MRIKFLIILIIAFFTNCENSSKSIENKKKNLTEERLDNTGIIELHDESGNTTSTFYKDSTYIGLISYKGALDSLTTKIFNEDDYPMRMLIYYKSDIVKEDLIYRFKDLNNKFISQDTFYAANHNKIPFEVTFEQSGINHINGIIEDIVYLKLMDTSKLRMISNKILISTKVEVIEYKLEVPSQFKT